MLLVVQAAGVALGAVPVFLLARKHLGGEWSGLCFALVYLLYPPTQWLVVDDFHPVALATPLLLGAIWFLDENRLLPFALCAVAACLTKEQVGLVVAMLGIWHAFGHGRRRAGLVIFATGTLVAVIATAVVDPALRAGRRVAVRRPLRRRRRLAGGHRQDRRAPPAAAPPDRVRGPRHRLPLGSAGAARRPAVARSARHAHRPARDRAQRPLEHADAALDPLPLHGRRDPRADRGRGARWREAAAPAARLVAVARSRPRRARPRGGHRDGAAPGLASRAFRLDARSPRSHRQRRTTARPRA